MFSFFSKQKTAFGLDLSKTALRMMQLERYGKQFFPNAFTEVRIPDGYIHEEVIQNLDGLAKLIEFHFKHPSFGVFRTPYVVLSVPEAKSFVRVITVPKMSEQEAAEAVPFEAEQYIPVSGDQVYLDYRILSEPRVYEQNKMRVIITATPKTLVDNYLQVIKMARLKPVAVEVESEAVARALISAPNQKEPSLILDIDTYHTSLIIYDLGSLQFTSSIPIAGNAFTNQIAQTLTISPEEAEKVKKQIGLLSQKDGGKVRAALLPLVESLVEAIMNTINFYQQHSENSREIKRIFLCGGGSKLKGLLDQLNQRLGARSSQQSSRFVQIGDPWINVLEKPLKKVPPISKADSISFTTVIGLALRGIEMK